jgi:hypothetical protein
MDADVEVTDLFGSVSTTCQHKRSRDHSWANQPEQRF